MNWHPMWNRQKTKKNLWHKRDLNRKIVAYCYRFFSSSAHWIMWHRRLAKRCNQKWSQNGRVKERKRASNKWICLPCVFACRTFYLHATCISDLQISKSEKRSISNDFVNVTLMPGNCLSFACPFKLSQRIRLSGKEKANNGLECEL